MGLVCGCSVIRPMAIRVRSKDRRQVPLSALSSSDSKSVSGGSGRVNMVGATIRTTDVADRAGAWAGRRLSQQHARDSRVAMLSRSLANREEHEGKVCA